MTPSGPPSALTSRGNKARVIGEAIHMRKMKNEIVYYGGNEILLKVHVYLCLLCNQS